MFQILLPSDQRSSFEFRKNLEKGLAREQRDTRTKSWSALSKMSSPQETFENADRDGGP